MAKGKSLSSAIKDYLNTPLHPFQDESLRKYISMNPTWTSADLPNIPERVTYRHMIKALCANTLSLHRYLEDELAWLNEKLEGNLEPHERASMLDSQINIDHKERLLKNLYLFGGALDIFDAAQPLEKFKKNKAADQALNDAQDHLMEGPQLLAALAELFPSSPLHGILSEMGKNFESRAEIARNRHKGHGDRGY